MPFRFPKVQTTQTASPLAYNPTLMVIAPEYDDGSPGGPGTWYAQAGADLTGSDSCNAVDGAPDFDGSTAVVVSSDTLGDMISTTAYHVVIAVDFDGFTHVMTTTPDAEACLLSEADAKWGVAFYIDGGGARIAALYDFDGAQRVATVDMSAAIDAGGVGTAVLQFKKTGGNLYAKIGTGTWQTGDACGATSAGTANTIRIGSNAGGTRALDGRIRALAIFDAAQDDTFAGMIPTWAATVPTGWTRRSPGSMPTTPNYWYWRDGCQTEMIRSGANAGRLLSIGGWNNETPGGPGWTQNVCNEVWKSDDRGDTWSRLLANDDSAPATARFARCHTIGVTHYDGKVVVIGDEAQSGNVYQSDDGSTWTQVCTTAPSSGLGNFMVGTIGSTIYLMGGQSGSLGAVTAHQEVHKSTDGGASWNVGGQPANAPWAGRGTVWRAVEHKGHIYVIGGGIYDFTVTEYSAVYRFDGTTWTEVLVNNHGLFDPSIHIGVCSTGDRLWIFNGNHNGTDLRRCLYSEDDGETWHVFKGGAGGPESHADDVFFDGSRIIRRSGLSGERTIHVFEYMHGPA